MRAVCDIVVQKVTGLRGDIAGVLPRPPIAISGGGLFVTATYAPGQVAVWRSTGEFVRTVGRGPGDGPGEFRGVAALHVSADGILQILSTTAVLIRYRLDGTYVGSVRLEGSSVDALEMHGEAAIVALRERGAAPRSTYAVRVREDGDVDSLSLEFRHRLWPIVAVDSTGIWFGVRDLYRITHRVFDEKRLVPGESPDRSHAIERETDWFPARRIDPERRLPPARTYGRLMWVAVDAGGFLWVRANEVDGASARSLPGASGGEAGVPTEIEIVRRIEALSPAGLLLGSRLIDPELGRFRPVAGRGGLWYVVEGDFERSITIYRTRLEEWMSSVENGDSSTPRSENP